MKHLNPQIARLAKQKKKTLVKKQIACGIFQDLEPNKNQSVKETHLP